MRPISELPRAEAEGLDGLLFDLDDTVLDRGQLSEAAYAALFRLRAVSYTHLTLPTSDLV